MPRVLFTPTLVRDPAQPYHALLAIHGFDVVFPQPAETTFDPPTLVKYLSASEAMLASTEPITAQIMDQCPKLRVIARWGVGYDSIDIAAATERKIVVTISPGVLEESVAEHTLALMLAVSRGVIGRDREVRGGVWRREVLPRLAGRTLGIIGLGRIGRAVAQKARAIGMQIVAYDPLATAAAAETVGAKLTALDDLLTTADVVTLHCASTVETKNLINARTLAQMKRDAILVNTGRGDLVDEAALCEALRAGRLLGAALDVFAKEPLPLSSPLLAAENLILAPHMGGLDDQTVIDAPRLAAQCIVDLAAGRWPEPCIVNRQLGPGWRW